MASKGKLIGFDPGHLVGSKMLRHATVLEAWRIRNGPIHPGNARCGLATVSRSPPQYPEPEALQNVLARVGASPKPLGPDPQSSGDIPAPGAFLLFL